MTVDYFGPEAPLIDLSEFTEWIIHEDSDVLVLNKPGWIVCHPSKNGPLSSLVGAAREYTKQDTLHLVARLDRETSGVVVIARHKASARSFQMALQQRHVDKSYLCILAGEMKKRTEVSRALEPDDDSPVAVKQRVSVAGGGQKAQTTFKPLTQGGGYTIANATPHTGRKHQIRAHAQWLGYPVVGDKIYGPDESLYLEFVQHGWTDRLEASLPIKRQALHCLELTFDLEDASHTFRSTLPEDMCRFCLDTMGLDRQQIESFA